MNLDKYDATKVVKSSSLYYNKINSQVKQESVHKIHFVEVEMQDNRLIDAGLWTEEEASTMRPVHDGYRPLEYNDIF